MEELARGEETLDALLEALASVPSPTDLRKVSEDAGIPSGRWFSGGSLAASSASLVSQAVRDSKLPDLIDAFALSFPNVLRQPVSS